jgi:hypothetical protein
MQPDDKFALNNITRKLKGIFAGVIPGVDDFEKTTKRGATKRPFDAAYRAKRKVRMRMQKRSRRINRARK